MKIKKICLIIEISLLLYLFAEIALAISGAGTTINITKGQIDFVSIVGDSIYNVRGTSQSNSFLENSSATTQVRAGILAPNAAPEQPALLYPPNNSYHSSDSINFQWVAEDQNNDTLTFLLEVFNDSDSTQIYYRNDSIEAENYNLSLPEETSFYWRVKSNDSEYNSTFSELRTFTIDRTYPTEFNLTSPANNSASTDTTPPLSWLPATEINLDNYTIEFCDNIDCSNATFIGASPSESFSNWTTDKALSGGLHYWRVLATDKANNQNSSDTFFYTVQASVTETITTTISGGTTETGGGAGTQLYSLSIISPPDVTIYSNDSLTLPLVVINPVNSVTLSGISLNVTSDSEDVSSYLAETYIDRLRPKEQRTVPLTIVTHTMPGTYGITISAKIENPPFTDKVRILANLIEKDSAEKSQVSKQLSFAKDLLDGNPECLDLREYITQAESSLSEGKYDQALNLVKNAIESCQLLISTQREVVKKPEIKIPNIVNKNKTIFILIGESLAFILVIGIIYKIFKKKKP